MKKGEKQFLYSTIRRGRIKVTSLQQEKLLEVRKLPHTHVYCKNGKIIKLRRFSLPGYNGHPYKKGKQK